MEIDNFDEILKHIDFVSPNDRYIVHIMRRPKDCVNTTNELGSNETQRLIRTYYIDSIEYFKKKIPAIKELCKSCNARAYIILSPRDNFECLLNLGKKVLDTIQNKNYSIKPDHLIRQAYCEIHKSRKKIWLLDIDDSDVVEYIKTQNIGGVPFIITEKTWAIDQILDLVRNEVAAIGRDPNEIYTVKTRNGCHIITPPFNLQEAQKKCSLLYEGVKKHIVGYTSEQIDPDDPHYNNAVPLLNIRYEPIYKDIVGWLHKDAMTLLYIPERNENA